MSHHHSDWDVKSSTEILEDLDAAKQTVLSDTPHEESQVFCPVCFSLGRGTKANLVTESAEHFPFCSADHALIHQHADSFAYERAEHADCKRKLEAATATLSGMRRILDIHTKMLAAIDEALDD